MKIRIAMYTYIHPLSLSLPLALYGPLFPCDAAPSLSPPRYRSTPLSGCSPLFVTAVSPLKHCAPSLSLSSLPLFSSFSPTCSFRRSQSTLLRPLVVCVTFLVTTRRVVLPPRSSSVYFWTMDPKKRFNDPIRSRTGTRTYAPTDEYRRKS